MTKIEQFITEIKAIKEQLNILENKYAELYRDYEGDEFDTQNKYVTEFENLTLLVTHELSSQISFGVSNLQTLSKLITFRKKHKEFNHEALVSIIDKNINAKEKLEVLKTKKTKNIDDIKAEWNRVFKNIGYEKLCEKLRLKIF